MEGAVAEARAAVLARFRWIDGHSDLWSIAEDASSFAATIAGLAALAAEVEPSAIAGIETRGVLFGAPTAHALDLGFHTLRKGDGLFAGESGSVATQPDYREAVHTLRVRGTFEPGERVVLVDDWIERGSQARAARTLIEASGAVLAGVVVIVDDSDGSLPVRSLVASAELPPWAGQ